MSITLTTTPQEIASNLSNTIGLRLRAWYESQSGNTATVKVALDVISQGTAYTGTNKTYNLIANSEYTGTQTFTQALTQDTWTTIATATLASTAGGTQINASATVWTYVYNSTSTGTSDLNPVYLPSFVTPPTGLAVSSVSVADQSITATVSLASWGTGGTSTVKKLWVSRSADMANKKYAESSSSSLSTSFTINNSSAGDSSWDLINNGRYYYMGTATNGVEDVYTAATAFVTTLDKITTNLASVDDTTATIAYSSPIDGGAYQKKLELSLDDGATWTVVATPPSNQVTNSQFTIGGLARGTSYTAKLRTIAGTQQIVDTITFTTTNTYKACGLYGSDNGTAEKITKYYVPVNGTAQFVLKMYGSDNGVAKRIY